MGSNCCSTASIVTRRLQLLVSGVQLLVHATKLFYGRRQKQDKTTRQDNWVELEASLTPAEAEVEAVAKADQYFIKA